jgi:hypothetical protein
LYERLGYQRRGDPIEDCWWRLRDDGSHEEVRELSHVMVKGISSEAHVAQQINVEITNTNSLPLCRICWRPPARSQLPLGR